MLKYGILLKRALRANFLEEMKMKKNIVRILAAAMLSLALIFTMASCDMLPPELQETINGLIGGGKKDCTHEETKMVATVAPTCKTTGIGNKVCSECGEILESNVVMPKSETHTPGEWETVIEPTCVRVGERCKKCTVCKLKVETEELATNDSHSYGWTQYGVKCSDCKADLASSVGLEFSPKGNGNAAVVGIGSCTDVHVVIPEKTPAGDTVTEIAAAAFRGNTTVLSFTVPDTVTYIASDAFKDARYTAATVPAAVTPAIRGSYLTNLKITGTGAIPNDAMMGSQALRAVHIGDGVRTIGNNAFKSCSVLKTIEMADSVTTIGDSAFSSCITLKSIYIGKGVVTIGKQAFHNCDFLSTVYIPASVESIGARCFYQSPRIDTVVFEKTDGWYIGTTPVSSETVADTTKAVGVIRSDSAITRK